MFTKDGYEAQEGSPPQVTRSLFFKAPGHQVTFFHEKIKTTQVTGRFFKLSRSRGRPQNGPRSQVAKNPSWASDMVRPELLDLGLRVPGAGSEPVQVGGGGVTNL